MEVEVKKGIKEISEVLEGLKVVGVAGVKVMADGKVNGEDIPALVELAKQHEVLIAAVSGADEVLEEGKDLDISELALIGSKAVEIVKAIKAAKA